MSDERRIDINKIIHKDERVSVHSVIKSLVIYLENKQLMLQDNMEELRPTMEIETEIDERWHYLRGARDELWQIKMMLKALEALE